MHHLWESQGTSQYMSAFVHCDSKVRVNLTSHNNMVGPRWIRFNLDDSFCSLKKASTSRFRLMKTKKKDLHQVGPSSFVSVGSPPTSSWKQMIGMSIVVAFCICIITWRSEFSRSCGDVQTHVKDCECESGQLGQAVFQAGWVFTEF